MMMTGCDLSAITKPWEVQSKVGDLHRRHLMMGKTRNNHVEMRGLFYRWL